MVWDYKHLGTFVDSRGAAFTNATHRAQTAIQAYTPLAFKLFGSDRLEDRYKLAFTSS